MSELSDGLTRKAALLLVEINSNGPKVTKEEPIYKLLIDISFLLGLIELMSCKENGYNTI